MIGADILILLFGLGVLALTVAVGRAAMAAARNRQCNGTVGFGLAAVVLALIGLYCVADGVIRLALG